MAYFSKRIDITHRVKRHRNTITLSILIFLFVGAVYTGPGMAKDAAEPESKQIKRGEYLVSTSGCHDCHTPWIMKSDGPGPDMSRALSGHPEGLVMPPPPKMEGPWLWTGAVSNTAFGGPWGVSYAKNLTPDPTGLGTWTEKEFIAAIRNGKDRGNGRPILPPMPWPVYRNMADDDLKAIFAYLKTIPPIKNTPPPPVSATAAAPSPKAD